MEAGEFEKARACFAALYLGLWLYGLTYADIIVVAARGAEASGLVSGDLWWRRFALGFR